MLTPSKESGEDAREEIDKQAFKEMIKRKVAEVARRIGEERGYQMDKVVIEEKEVEYGEVHK